MKLPKIKFDFKALAAKQKNSDWLKSVYVILTIATFAMIAMIITIYFLPASEAISNQVKKNVSTDEIKIDIKTLELIKTREFPK